MATPEKCPPVPTAEESTEAIKIPKKAKPQEKLPVTSERLKIFEERLKGTSWKVTNVDTTPTYKTYDFLEHEYGNLSDAAAEKKGIKRTYDEKGRLIKTEIAESLDHKITLELGGKDFMKKLPLEVRQYMKSLGFSGPNIMINNILIAEDGTANAKKMSLRATDRNFGASFTQDLEGKCKKALKSEDGLLTAKALQNMEKAAIELYTQQTAMHLDDTSVEAEKTQADAAYLEGVGKDIDRMTNEWVSMGKTAFIAKKSKEDYYGEKDQSTVSKIKDKNGHGIVWNNIAGSSFYGFSINPADRDQGINYSVKVYVDLATGNIGKVVLNKSQQNKGGLIPSQESIQEGESELLTNGLKGKPISVGNLGGIKATLADVIQEAARKKTDEEVEGNQKKSQQEAYENQQKIEESDALERRKEIVFSTWENILAPMHGDEETVTLDVGSLGSKEGFMWRFIKLDDNNQETIFTLHAYVDIKTGKFDYFKLLAKKNGKTSLDSFNSTELSAASADLTGIFKGKKLSRETAGDLVGMTKDKAEESL